MVLPRKVAMPAPRRAGQAAHGLAPWITVLDPGDGHSDWRAGRSVPAEDSAPRRRGVLPVGVLPGATGCSLDAGNCAAPFHGGVRDVETPDPTATTNDTK